MAFVNEFVSPEDFEKYGFKEINKQFRMIDDETNWTIDRERDIYIRKISWMGPSPGFVRFHVYWKGNLFFAYIIYGHENTRMLKELDIPKHLIVDKEEIIDALREALAVFGEDGVNSFNKGKKAIIKF